MADNVAITAGLGTSIATDEIGGIHYQRVKPQVGEEGSAADVSDTNPLPVSHPPQATALTEAAINAASSGDNTLVSGVANTRIRVYRAFFKVNGSGTGVSAKFKTGSTDFHPALPFNDKDGMVLDYAEYPWFTCGVAEDLKLNLSAAIQVSGRLYYTQD